jgi:hypothetical protein
MRVFITREYQHGDDTGEIRAYASLEGALRSVEGRFPARDRFRWRQYAPGKWLGRIVGDWRSYSAYVDELPVEEGGK